MKRIKLLCLLVTLLLISLTAMGQDSVSTTSQSSPLRLELTLPSQEFRLHGEKYILLTAINKGEKDVELPSSHSPGHLDVIAWDSASKKRLDKGFVSFSTGAYQGNFVDFHKIQAPQSVSGSVGASTISTAPISNITTAPDKAYTPVPVPSVAIFSDPDPNAPKGIILKPGESAEAEIGLDEFYLVIPIGKHDIQAAMLYEGAIVASPVKNFSVVEGKKLSPEERQLYAEVELSPREEAVKKGKEFLSLYPDSELAHRVRMSLWESATIIKDWPTVAEVAEHIYTSKELMRRNTRIEMGKNWASGLWKSGRKKEAETLIAGELADKGGAELLKRLKATDLWEKQRAIQAAPPSP